MLIIDIIKKYFEILNLWFADSLPNRRDY